MLFKNLMIYSRFDNKSDPDPYYFVKEVSAKFQ